MAAKKDSTNEEIQQDLTTLPDDEATAAADDEPAASTDEPAAAALADGISLLDRSKDYGEVYGMAGVTYTQGDKYFNREGLEVTPQLEA